MISPQSRYEVHNDVWHSNFNERYPYQRSLWHAALPTIEPSPFEPGASFDVAIVGAGVSGAVAAWRLCQLGARVALIEANTFAAGASGRSGGFIVPAFSVVRPGQLIEQRGDPGVRLLRSVAASATEFFETALEAGAEHDARQGGWLNPAHDQQALDRIGEDCRVWQSLGVSLQMLDAADTKRMAGASGYVGALFAPTGGTAHPARFVHSVIRAACELGVSYLPQTQALTFRRREGGWQLQTSRGDVIAAQVLICTNARSKISMEAQRSVVPLRICQIATAPIPPAQRTRLLQQGQCLSDTRMNLFSYRFDPDWRLISGGMPILPTSSGRRAGRAIAQRLQRVLGLDTEPPVEHVWFGEASVTADRLPAIFELAAGVYAFTACNGRGLAMSVQLSRSIARAMAGGSFSDLPLAPRQPRAVRQRQFQTVGARLYPLYGDLKDALRGRSTT